MKELSDNCSDIVLLLTEYYRNQLRQTEEEHVKSHLKRCNYCVYELKEIKNLCTQTDKLIPYLKNDFDKKLIYSIFIQEKKEDFINRIVALTFIIFIIFFSFIKHDYKIISLNEIQMKANELFTNESMIIEKDESY